MLKKLLKKIEAYIENEKRDFYIGMAQMRDYWIKKRFG